MGPLRQGKDVAAAPAKAARRLPVLEIVGNAANGDMTLKPWAPTATSYVYFITCVILAFPANKSVANTRYSADSQNKQDVDMPLARR
jgi:hypothetical protein